LCLSPASSSVEPGGKDPGVIEYDQVVWFEEIRELTKPAVVKFSRGAIYLQQARSGAIRKRFLRYQVWRKLIIEIADQHAA